MMKNNILISREDIIKDLQETISDKRLRHILGVEETAIKLSQIYNVSSYKAMLAALLHDYAKEFTIEDVLFIAEKNKYSLDELERESTDLSHSKIGALIAKQKYNINDEDVLNAIKYHTTGRENMSMLEKIIFISDAIEPSRNYRKVDEIRNMAFLDIDKAILLNINNTINFLISTNKCIHPDTILCRNDFIKRGIYEKDI